MGTSFLQNLRKNIPSNWDSFISKGILPSNFATIMNDLRNRLMNSLNISNAFIATFSSIVLDTPDEMCENQFDVADYVSQVDGRADFLATLEDFFSKFGSVETINDSDYQTIVVTSSTGRIFKLCWDGTDLYSFDGSLLHPLVEQGLSEDASTVHFLVAQWKSEASETEFYSINDLLLEQSENISLTEVMHDTVSIVLAGKDSINSKLSTILDGIDTTWDTAVTLGKRVIRGWTTGGLYGVIMVILDYIRGPASASISSNNRLTFTDVKSLAPQAYLAGLIPGVVSILGTVASLIVSIWSKTVGLLFAALTSVASQLVSAINYSATIEEKAKLISDTNCIGMLSPSFGDRGVRIVPQGYDANNVIEKVKQDYPFIQLNEIFLASVPGGLLLGVLNDQGEFSFEFHPDCIDRRDWLGALKLCEVTGDVDTSGSTVTISLNPGVTTSSGVPFATVIHNFEYAYQNQVAPGVSGTWPSTALEDTPSDWVSIPFIDHQYENNSVGVLDDVDGNALSKITMINIAIHLLWLSWFSDGSSNPVYPNGNRMDLQWAVALGVLGTISKARFYDYQGTASSWYNWGNVQAQHTQTKDLISIFVRALAYCTVHYVRSATWAYADKYLVWSWGLWANFSSLFSAICSQFDSVEVSWRSPSSTMIAATSSSVMYEWGLTITKGYSYIYGAGAAHGKLDSNGIELLGSGLSWYFEQPKYTPGSVLRTVIGIAVAVAVVAVTAVVVTSVAKVKLNQKKLALAGKVNKAWDDYYKNPADTAALKQYKRACLKNNLFTKIFGGSQYNAQGLWAASDDQSGSLGETIRSKASQYMNDSLGEHSDQDATVFNCNDIVKLINPNFRNNS